jgi:hypothetical protein
VTARSCSPARCADGPPLRDPTTATPSPGIGAAVAANAPAHAPAHLRHHYARCRRGFADVQIAARHADPRTIMRYDRARKNLDATRTTSSPRTWPPVPDPSISTSTERPGMPMSVRFEWVTIIDR